MKACLSWCTVSPSDIKCIQAGGAIIKSTGMDRSIRDHAAGPTPHSCTTTTPKQGHMLHHQRQAATHLIAPSSPRSLPVASTTSLSHSTSILGFSSARFCITLEARNSLRRWTMYTLEPYLVRKVAWQQQQQQQQHQHKAYDNGAAAGAASAWQQQWQ